MKSLLLLFALAGFAYAGPKTKDKPTTEIQNKIYAAFGERIARGTTSDGTVYYGFTCVNIKGDEIIVTIRQQYIDIILKQTKQIDYK